jgi:hypothetical protein
MLVNKEAEVQKTLSRLGDKLTLLMVRVEVCTVSERDTRYSALPVIDFCTGPFPQECQTINLPAPNPRTSANEAARGAIADIEALAQGLLSLARELTVEMLGGVEDK